MIWNRVWSLSLGHVWISNFVWNGLNWQISKVIVAIGNRSHLQINHKSHLNFSNIVTLALGQTSICGNSFANLFLECLIKNHESILRWNPFRNTHQNPHKLPVVALTYDLGWTFQVSGANRQKVWFFRDDNLKASPRLGCRFEIIANQSYGLVRQRFGLYKIFNVLQNEVGVYWH